MWLKQLVFVLIMGLETVKGFVYLGCYMDLINEKRIFTTRQQDSSSNTPADCARRCSRYRYFGVEFEDECFCGDTLNALKTTDSDCNKRCSGDRRQICGGSNRISVYTNWDCGPPPVIANGYVRVRYNDHIINGAIADVHCNRGFIGQPTITCRSDKSWEKATCQQTDINECAPAPCKNGATCTNLQNGYSCTCSMGWQGNNCDQRGSTHPDVGVGIGVAVGLLCAVGAVVVLIVLRRRKLLPCLNTTSTYDVGNHVFKNGPDHIYDESTELKESNTNGPEQSYDEITELKESNTNGPKQTYVEITKLKESNTNGPKKTYDEITKLKKSNTNGPEQSYDEITEL